MTRFGLLTVVGFFVGLLVSLYRYNLRLAAFYRARADALLLLSHNLIAGVKTLRGFEAFDRIFTPKLDFGKTPQTPATGLIDLVRAIRGVERANG